MSAAPLQRQPAQFGKRLDGCFTAVTAEAAVFHAAKRYMGLIIHGAVIDVGHARLQAIGDRQSFLFITGDDAC